jgi:hypothetical protein
MFSGGHLYAMCKEIEFYWIFNNNPYFAIEYQNFILFGTHVLNLPRYSSYNSMAFSKWGKNQTLCY